MNYKKTYIPAIGYTKLCEIEKCSCKRLEFGMIELNAGDSVTIETEGKEYAFIFVFGHADVKVGDVEWKNVGGRMNVFEGPAHSVCVPRNSTVTFTGCVLF
jgi:5-deoxy-glucuronate isomerase